MYVYVCIQYGMNECVCIICMYIYICVYYMYVYIYIYIYIHICMYIYICTHVHLHTLMIRTGILVAYTHVLIYTGIHTDTPMVYSYGCVIVCCYDCVSVMCVSNFCMCEPGMCESYLYMCVCMIEFLYVCSLLT